MITEELFCKSIEALRNQSLYDIKTGELVQEAFGVEIGLLYNNNILITAVIDLLASEFDREELEHYIFDLNYGRIGGFVETEQELYQRLSK